MHTKLEDVRLRSIEKKDNEALAKLIRNTLKEFSANHPGTVYYDEAQNNCLRFSNASLCLFCC